ncbi:hypothetical protein lerEdw1_009900 [Lerista edwardsae]|nr:hypothetical protein lerEdw1_009900 [Lerista edwardsae]
MPRERRAGQLMDPPWRERNWASGAATVVVLILTFLCKGMRSQWPGYSLTAPASVSVQRGLCVHIPCTFTYPGQSQTYPTPLHVYWFKDKEWTEHSFKRYDKVPGQLVATNDERQTVYSSAGGRFQLTGNPAHGDCSFSISDAKDEDDEHYYLRINDGRSTVFSYRNGYIRPRVNVAELTEKPEIQKSSEMISGKPVTLTCQAPGTCSGIPPRISWTPYSVRSSAVDWQQPHSNGSRTYSSNITITSSQYEGQDLTCSVSYPGGNWASVANTIHVATACSSPQKPYRNPVSVMVEEGDTLSFLCEADGIPDPLLSWTKGNKTLSDSKQAGGHSLQLSEIRSEDAGLYRCQATNLIGSAEKTVRVNVQYPPRQVQLSVSQTHEWDPVRAQDPPRAVDTGSQLMAREGNTLRLSCAADASPPVEVSWAKGGRTLKEWSPAPDHWLELTNLTVEDKGEYTCCARNTLASVQSTFQLDIAFAPKLLRKNSTCQREGKDFHCTCTLQSWPAPQIWWQVAGETLTGNSSTGALTVTSWLQGKKIATSNLRWMGSLDKDRSIICLGNNSVGIYTMQFLLSKAGSGAAVLISGFCGALLAAILCLIGVFLIRFYKQRKASMKAGSAEAGSAVREEQPNAKNPSLIYGNIFPANPRTPQVGRPKAAREMNPEPSHPPRAPRLAAADPGELHYATLEFNLKNRGTPTLSEDSVEYSAVRVQ